MSNTRYHNTYIDGCSHFCTASVVDYLPPLTRDGLREAVLKSWNKQRARWGVLIQGFVIMPEHTHVMLRGSGDAVRKFMQYSLAETSREISTHVRLRAKAGDAESIRWLQTFSDRANGPAHFKVWKERFRCIALNQEGAVQTRLQYLHLNPVERGLVDAPEKWKWSSFSHYQGEQCVLRIDSALSCGNS